MQIQLTSHDPEKKIENPKGKSLNNANQKIILVFEDISTHNLFQLKFYGKSNKNYLNLIFFSSTMKNEFKKI